MAFDNYDIRKWFEECARQMLNEAFSPMKSLAGDAMDVSTASVDLDRASRKEIMAELIDAFVDYMERKDVDMDAVPPEVYDALRFVLARALSNVGIDE